MNILIINSYHQKPSMKPKIEIYPDYCFESVTKLIPYFPDMSLDLHKNTTELSNIRLITDKPSDFYDSLFIRYDSKKNKIKIGSNQPKSTLFFLIKIETKSYSHLIIDKNGNEEKVYNTTNLTCSFCHLPGLHGYQLFSPVNFMIDTSEIIIKSKNKHSMIDLRNNEKYELSSSLDLDIKYDIYKFDDYYYFMWCIPPYYFIRRFIKVYSPNSRKHLKEDQSFPIVTTSRYPIGFISNQLYEIDRKSNEKITTIVSNDISLSVPIDINLVFESETIIWKDTNENSHILLFYSTIILVNKELTEYIQMFDYFEENFWISDGILLVNGVLNENYVESKIKNNENLNVGKSETYLIKSPTNIIRFFYPEELQVYFNECHKPEFILYNLSDVGKEVYYEKHTDNELIEIRKDVGHTRLWFLCSLLLI